MDLRFRKGALSEVGFRDREAVSKVQFLREQVPQPGLESEVR